MLTAEDKLAIIDLVQQADNAATHRDYEQYANLYTEDGVMEGTQGNYMGRSQIATATKEVWSHEPAGSLHLTQNVTIKETDGSITVHSWLVIITQNDSRQILTTADVTQTINKTPDGWKICRRHIS
jgi:uncharacterized protein (TIGR02246 family)